MLDNLGDFHDCLLVLNVVTVVIDNFFDGKIHLAVTAKSFLLIVNHLLRSTVYTVSVSLVDLLGPMANVNLDIDALMIVVVTVGFEYLHGANSAHTVDQSIEKHAKHFLLIVLVIIVYFFLLDENIILHLFKWVIIFIKIHFRIYIFL